ncbi:hypothetical protein [Pseudonocardia yunnanensis]|uniref:Uncharacterized protein n=1 Tax=Pseudonocardia yunnanensis TaxID=58107 RepID=A0ABW4EMD6_9PSEU
MTVELFGRGQLASLREAIDTASHRGEQLTGVVVIASPQKANSVRRHPTGLVGAEIVADDDHAAWRPMAVGSEPAGTHIRAVLSPAQDLIA